MPKQGFKNQWVAISQKGKFADSSGVERDLNEDFLNKVISNFKANDAPAVIGHPKDNTPAFGWATALRLHSGVLEAQFADTDDEFEQMVEQGKFRKRSASFYLDPPSLRHVGFLGAMPPAVKGLRDIQFSDGDSVTVEISFNEEQIMEEKDVTKVADSLFDKLKGLFKPESAPSVVPPAAASFSEADAKSLVEDAVKTVTEKLTAEFNEKYTAIETANKTLSDQVNSMSTSGKRAEIASFVESIPAEKGKHFLKRAGIADFMEALAVADEADKEPAINFSEGEGDAKIEYKSSRVDWFKNFINAQKGFIEFGEKFGAITATKEVSEFADPERSKKINAALEIKEDGGDK